MNCLDTFTRDLLNHDDARGWVEQELPALFESLTTQSDALAARINAGVEPSSIAVSIVMDAPSRESITPELYLPAIPELKTPVVPNVRASFLALDARIKAVSNRINSGAINKSNNKESL